MNKFHVIQPPALLAPYVKQYWFLTMNHVEQIAQRLVPFGCMALIFHRRECTRTFSGEDYMPPSYLYGVNTGYTDLYLSGPIDFICIVFQPGGASAFFRMPVDALSNTYIPLDLLNDPELCELEHQLNGVFSHSVVLDYIEQFLFCRLDQGNNYTNKRIQAIINSIDKGESDLTRLADTACLGYKQFKRIFRSHIGTTPKNYLKINRFQKLLHYLQQHTGLTIDQLASECGYYDKSHLIKELKEFSGFTPAALLKASDPVYSPYHALFRSAFIDLPFP